MSTDFVCQAVPKLQWDWALGFEHPRNPRPLLTFFNLFKPLLLKNRILCKRKELLKLQKLKTDPFFGFLGLTNSANGTCLPPPTGDKPLISSEGKSVQRKITCRMRTIWASAHCVITKGTKPGRVCRSRKQKSRSFDSLLILNKKKLRKAPLG